MKTLFLRMAAFFSIFSYLYWPAYGVELFVNEASLDLNRPVQELIVGLKSIIPDSMKPHLLESSITLKTQKSWGYTCLNEQDFYRISRRGQAFVLEINQSLWNSVVDGEGDSSLCPNISLDNNHLLKLSLLNAIATIFDSLRIRHRDHQKVFQTCLRELRSTRNRPYTAHCRMALEERDNQTSISGLRPFKRQVDWLTTTLGGFENKNRFEDRDLSSQVSQDLQSTFSSNFARFILDPNYRCQRPSFYQFFSYYFNTRPHTSNECQVNTTIFMDDTKEEINLSPDRVYRVDYLLAGKGKGIGGFGHSMFRLIVCAPFRKEVSEDCVHDTSHHVVLSYRANIDDIKSDVIKGLIGGYDSILFFFSMPKLKSIPLENFAISTVFRSS